MPCPHLASQGQVPKVAARQSTARTLWLAGKKEFADCDALDLSLTSMGSRGLGGDCSAVIPTATLVPGEGGTEGGEAGRRSLAGEVLGHGLGPHFLPTMP